MTRSAVTVFDVNGGQGSKLMLAPVLKTLVIIYLAAQQIQNFSPAGVTGSAQGMATF